MGKFWVIRFNIKHISICFELNILTSIPGWSIVHLTSKELAYLNQVISLDYLAGDE